MDVIATFESEVVHGEARGREVGMPTANMVCDDISISLINKVFASYIYIDENDINGNTKTNRYIGVTNIGTRPSVTDSKKITIETNIIDFDKDIYGKIIRVELIEYIRDTVKFKNLNEVKEQVDKDKLYAIKKLKI